MKYFSFCFHFLPVRIQELIFLHGRWQMIMFCSPESRFVRQPGILDGRKIWGESRKIWDENSRAVFKKWGSYFEYQSTFLPSWILFFLFIFLPSYLTNFLSYFFPIFQLSYIPSFLPTFQIVDQHYFIFFLFLKIFLHICIYLPSSFHKYQHQTLDLRKI